MIGVIFQHTNQLIDVRVIGNECLFRTNDFGGAYVSIDGLKLDKQGVLKEHPDLVNDKNWREITIERFKKRLKEMKGEEKKMDYVITELKKCGYKPLYKQKQGHRPQKL